MPNTEGLRYQRTEAAIREAFLGLLAQMPLERVGVSRLCDEARISRNAFGDMHRGPSEVMTRHLVEDG